MGGADSTGWAWLVTSSVWDQLVAMGEEPTEWGFSNRHGARDEPLSFIDQPGRVEVRRSPGSALLDPMRFAARLIASSARIIDRAFEILNLGSDPRLDDQPSLEPAHLQWPSRPNDREVLLMTSPLSGLL